MPVKAPGSEHARVEELDAQLAELHVAMAAAEAVEGHNGEMSDGEEMALESAPPVMNAHPVDLGEAVSVSEVKGMVDLV